LLTRRFIGQSFGYQRIAVYYIGLHTHGSFPFHNEYRATH